MERDKQVQAFEDQLDALVDRFSDEFDLDYASIIGCLQIKLHELCQMANTPDEDDK